MAELILAMDVPDRAQAQALAGRLGGALSWCKVGLELFISGGPELVSWLKEQGFHVFLDLKFYDIPNTVASAVTRAAALGVDMLTLHCQGGERMCRQAVAAARNAARDGKAAPMIFGVTALTSFANGEMPGIAGTPSEFALELARLAKNWGLDGLVCSGHEVKGINSIAPELLKLCPGIRPAWADAGDQRRVMTPAQAVRAGADYLVVGRPVLAAPDPLAAVESILSEMQDGSEE